MLDDIEIISEIDKANMMKSILSLPNQIEKSLQIMESLELEIDNSEIRNLLFCGMGGSGISGDIIANLYKKDIKLPMFVNRSYTLPNWANKKTLVFIQSYSGNTEETLNSINEAINKKCKIIGFTSNGIALDRFLKSKIPFVKIPTGFQPRVAIGYLLITLLSILDKLGFINLDLRNQASSIIKSINTIIESNKIETSFDNNLSKKIASKLHFSIPQIYGWDIYKPVARRYYTQFNENSKIISKYDYIPECNHNDLVGWAHNIEISKKFSCILFRDENLEDKRIKVRLDFMKNLFEKVAKNVIEIKIQDDIPITKVINAIYLGDFISYYLAILRNVDPTPINIINDLKYELLKV